jgi:molybdenum cofactor biosynthesis protein B
MSRVVDLHKSSAPTALGIFIVTCSTSKFQELSTGTKPDDASGDIIEQLAVKAGHHVEGRELISDSKTMIQRTLKHALATKAVDAVIITGGTGLSQRDVTVESAAPMMEKEIPGFGELFRKISYDKIGPAAMMSRALAGSVKGKMLFCLPGSPDAVQTAMEQLILPELGHMIRIVREHSNAHGNSRRKH